MCSSKEGRENDTDTDREGDGRGRYRALGRTGICR